VPSPPIKRAAACRGFPSRNRSKPSLAARGHKHRNRPALPRGDISTRLISVSMLPPRVRESRPRLGRFAPRFALGALREGANVEQALRPDADGGIRCPGSQPTAPGRPWRAPRAVERPSPGTSNHAAGPGPPRNPPAPGPKRPGLPPLGPAARWWAKRDSNHGRRGYDLGVRGRLPASSEAVLKLGVEAVSAQPAHEDPPARTRAGRG